MQNSEQIFDMLPFVVDIYDKLQLDEYRKEINKKYKDKSPDRLEVGIEVIKYIVKNSGKIKEEFFGIVAVAEGKTVEEIKNQPFTKTVIIFKDIFTNQEMTDFFKQAMQ